MKSAYLSSNLLYNLIFPPNFKVGEDSWTEFLDCRSSQKRHDKVARPVLPYVSSSGNALHLLVEHTAHRHRSWLVVQELFLSRPPLMSSPLSYFDQNFTILPYPKARCLVSICFYLILLFILHPKDREKPKKVPESIKITSQLIRIYPKLLAFLTKAAATDPDQKFFVNHVLRWGKHNHGFHATARTLRNSASPT